MVIYDLLCEWGHRFEGWFQGHDAFEKQKAAGFVQCQICGNPNVSRIPTGGHAMKSPKTVKAAPLVAEPKPGMEAASQFDQVTLAKALRHYVKSHFENVGSQFSTLVREMHEGKIPAKDIYGEVTPKEQAKLTEDEVPHVILPEIPPEFEN